MKNYLVGAVRPVSTTWGYWKNQEEETQALAGHKKYEDMYRISRASARKFLQGDWEEIKFTAPVRDARMYQIAQWYVLAPTNFVLAFVIHLDKNLKRIHT
jgi:hypothetical protein